MKGKFPRLFKLAMALALVVGLVPVIAAPALAQTVTFTPAGGNVTVGQSIGLSGATWPVGAVITVTWDGAAVATSPAAITVPTSGAFTAGFLVPATIAGSHTAKVTDGVTSVTASYTVIPKLAVSPSGGKTGTTINLSGAGFGGGVAVAASMTGPTSLGSATVVLSLAGAPVSTDAYGYFNSSFAVPSTTVVDTVSAKIWAGPWTVNAQDGAGNNTAVAGTPATVTVRPSLSVSPTSGLPGASITVSGSNFTAGLPEGSPKILAGSLTFGAVALNAADITISTTTGSFSYTTSTVPPTAVSGTNVISAVDDSGAANLADQATTTFVVSPRPITSIPTTTPIGGTLTIQGSNFTPGPTGTVTSVTVGGTLATITSSGITTGGQLTAVVTVPVPALGTTGSQEVQVTDSGGKVGLGTVTLPDRTLTLNPTSGPRGSSILVTGTGFGRGGFVTITWTTGSLGTLVTLIADTSGNISGGITVPSPAATGENTITALDTTFTLSKTAKFTVGLSTVSLSASSGQQGSTVVITGDGFPTYSQGTASIIYAGGPYTAPPPVYTDAAGKFTYSLMIPGVVPPGTTVIMVTVGSYSGSQVFTVTTAEVTVGVALGNIAGKYTRVWGFDNVTKTHKLYDPAVPAISDLITLADGQGYWIYCTESVTLVYGAKVRSLTQGWNLMGW